MGFGMPNIERRIRMELVYNKVTLSILEGVRASKIAHN